MDLILDIDCLTDVEAVYVKFNNPTHLLIFFIDIIQVNIWLIFY